MKQTDDHCPRDPFNLVYVIFYWLGIGTLLPWNFFISVSEYWKFKWRSVVAIDHATGEDDVTGTFWSSSSPNDFGSGTSDATSGGGNNATTFGLNEMQTNWSSHLAVASMVPNVTMLLLNAAFGHRFKTQPRLLVSLCLVILLFFFTVAMAKVNTDEWQGVFYIVTLLSVVLININSAIFQGGLLGIAGKFPPRYMGGVFSGQALGGIFASATNITFLAFGANFVEAAFFSFVIAVVFLATALVGYVAVTRFDFFRFYAGEGGSASVTEQKLEDVKLMTTAAGAADEAAVDFVHPKQISPLQILLQIIFYAISIFLIFAVTLGCFPAITVLIISTDYGNGNAWADKYFIPVVCFLLFNVGDYLGRTVAEILRWPKPTRFGMILTFLLSLLRIVFVPLFVMCNANPNNREVTSVVFDSDYVYILLMLLFSVSNGYLGSICMMSAPQLCEPEEQQTAASLMVAFLGLGLGVGAALSNVFLLLI